MTDISIRDNSTVNAPHDYKIPGAQEILPKAVSAAMDGTGASGTWFPCMQVLDPNGNVMFSAISPTPLAVGASADVSWFRGLSQVPSSSAVLPGTGVDRHVTSQVVPNNAATSASFDTVLFDDLGWFNPGTPTKITVTIPGQYLCIYSNSWVYPAGAGFAIQTGISYNAGARVLVSEQVAAVAGTPNSTSGAAVVNANAGDAFTLFLYQISGGNMSTWIAGSAGTDVQSFPTLTVIRVGDRV